MPVDPRLTGLQRISTLVKDIHLADLRRAEAERAELLDRLAALGAPAPMAADLPPAVAAEVAMRYDRWAELRRREIEQALTQKAVECDALRARARLSLGRDQALAQLGRG